MLCNAWNCSTNIIPNFTSFFAMIDLTSFLEKHYDHFLKGTLIKLCLRGGKIYFILQIPILHSPLSKALIFIASNNTTVAAYLHSFC